MPSAVNQANGRQSTKRKRSKCVYAVWASMLSYPFAMCPSSLSHCSQQGLQQQASQPSNLLNINYSILPCYSSGLSPLPLWKAGAIDFLDATHRGRGIFVSSHCSCQTSTAMTIIWNQLFWLVNSGWRS